VAGEAQLDPRQQEMLQKYRSIRWQAGPCTAAIGNVGEVKVPAGYRFTDGAGTRIWSELTGNMPNEHELGLLMPTGENEDWSLYFSFSEDGYVKDDDKDKLDAGAILESLRAGNNEANKYRAAHGIAPIEIVG